jgi:DtxR family transcriptional regulator, Mn-dependent transcriptional regulator
MPTITVENYLKQIYLAQGEKTASLVSLGALATTMNVVPGTVTTMAKSLSEAGLIHYEARQGVRLTRKGERLALAVLRRHRLIELFLVKVLNMDWSEVHVEAEELEHAVSDRLLQRIDDYLGNQQFDPHGDPIPSASGQVARRDLTSLSEIVSGQRVVVAQVLGQDAEFLSYLSQRGIAPVELCVLASDAVGGTMSLRIDQDELVIGRTIASKIRVSR